MFETLLVWLPGSAKLQLLKEKSISVKFQPQILEELVENLILMKFLQNHSHFNFLIKKIDQHMEMY